MTDSSDRCGKAPVVPQAPGSEPEGAGRELVAHPLHAATPWRHGHLRQCRLCDTPRAPAVSRNRAVLASHFLRGFARLPPHPTTVHKLPYTTRPAHP